MFSGKIIDFETYVEKTKSAKTKQDLFDFYSQAVAQHGLDRILLCLATDHRDIGETQGMNFMHNFPEDWMKYYFEQGFDKDDPVMIYSLQKAGSYRWSDISKNMRLNRRQKNTLNLGKEAGLNNGICTPLRGPNRSIAGLSLASSEKKDSFDGNIDMITAYSNHFYIKYRELGENELKNKDSFTKYQEIENISLNEKEREILLKMAAGKGRSDIAIILNMSENTVDWHTRNIYKKLQANDKTLAVVKAISYGLIHI